MQQMQAEKQVEKCGQIGEDPTLAVRWLDVGLRSVSLRP